MSDRLFRREAVARKGRREPIDGLLSVTAPHEWLVLVGLVASMLALLAWGFFGTAERGMSTECLMVFVGDRYSIRANIPGNVAEVFVDVGDDVDASQSLGKLTDNQLDREILLARAKLALLKENGDNSDAEQIALANQDLIELTALQSVGALVVSHVSGEVMRNDLVVGQSVHADEIVAVIRGEADDEMIAVAFVTSDLARIVKTGMRARINAPFATDDSTLNAEVAAVSGTPIISPSWLSDLGLTNENRGHLIRFALLDQPASNYTDGTACNVRIVYERGSPFSLIIP